MPLPSFLKREVKILLGVAVATAVGVKLYNTYNEDGIHDVPAARQRHDLALRAVASKHKGNYRQAILFYEELLQQQRTLARSRQRQKEEAQHPASLEDDVLAPRHGWTYDPTAVVVVQSFDVECQILSELGQLHALNKEYTQAIQYYTHALQKAVLLLPESASLNDRLGQTYQDMHEYRRSETHYVRALALLLPSETALELFTDRLLESSATRGSTPPPRPELLLPLTEFKQWYRDAVSSEQVGPDSLALDEATLERCRLACGVLYNYATLACEMGQLKKAENLIKRCFVVHQRLKVEEGGHTGGGQQESEGEEKLVALLELLVGHQE